MAVVDTPRARVHVDRLERIWAEPGGLLGLLTTTSHKKIGLMYFVTSLAFFAAGGVEALIMRAQLAQPGETVVGPERFNELFTLHGTTMIFLFVTPMLSGAFGNYLVPLLIGARDMAFPRMNALSYWVYLASGLFVYSSFLLDAVPNAGWFNYVPLADREFSPGLNIDFYDLGLLFLTISSTVGATNFIVTIFKLRAPGMSINRIPLFCWAILATSFSLVFALPALSAANIFLELERRGGFRFFDSGAGGDPVLWQHLFWIFGHPDVYIIFLPAVGIVGMIVPTFARRPMVAHDWVALSTAVTGFIGFGVWVHHMFAVGLPQATTVFYAAASLIIVIPSGIQIFAWCATLISGTPVLRTPLLYVLGFIVVFVVGGLTGVMFAAISFDQQVTDSYFVVAHFHYVLFGGAVFPLFAGMHYWFPKVTGRMYREGVARLGFWLFFAGFNLAFFPMHVAGLAGMPRRVYTYPGGLGWDVSNLLSTIGAFLLAAAILLVLANLAWGVRRGAPAGPDPWGGGTLEWATTSPPPSFNFAVVPTVRSATPNWDAESLREDQARLERGVLVLDGGEEQSTSTVLDADLDEVLSMPAESPWPFVLALALAGVFTLLISGHYVAALVMVGVAALALAAWHSKEPQEY